MMRDETADYPIYLTLEQTDAISIKQKAAYLWGYFLYEDVFGRLRKTGFGYVGHPYSHLPGSAFAGVLWGRVGGKAYNYDREEDPES